jgi:uncharacterized protein YndB with AHSA1/START domain
MARPGRKQLERAITVHAPVDGVYQLFMDNRALPEWAPVVDAVLTEVGGDESGVGRTRTCAVTMAGRSGIMVERCIEAVPGSRASFVVQDDSFGFTRTFRDYSFTAHFTSRPDGTSLVRIETFYTPASPIAALFNQLIMRRKFRALVDALLAGLRASAEQRHRANT